ncbi:MAG: GntR family transcriptional regulator [Alphaproteobacteria bacterium]
MSNTQSAKPRFRQIADSLKTLIQTSGFEPHDALPSERIIAEEHKVGRMTARRALEALEAEGLIYSKDRLGRFVSPKRLSYNVSSMRNFIENSADEDMPIELVFLDSTLEPANSVTAELLDLPPGTPVIVNKRLFKRENHSIFLETETISAEHKHAIDMPKARFSVLCHSADISIKMRALSQSEAGWLGLMPYQIGIEQNQINRDPQGKPICLTNQIWRGEMVEFLAKAVFKT